MKCLLRSRTVAKCPTGQRTSSFKIIKSDDEGHRPHTRGPAQRRTSLASTAHPHSETTPIYKAGFRCRARSSVKKSSTGCGVRLGEFPAAEAVDLVPRQPQPAVLGDHLRVQPRYGGVLADCGHASWASTQRGRPRGWVDGRRSEAVGYVRRRAMTAPAGRPGFGAETYPVQTPDLPVDLSPGSPTWIYHMVLSTRLSQIPAGTSMIIR
jgi:hypothetical protein